MVALGVHFYSENSVHLTRFVKTMCLKRAKKTRCWHWYWNKLLVRLLCSWCNVKAEALSLVYQRYWLAFFLHRLNDMMPCVLLLSTWDENLFCCYFPCQSVFLQNVYSWYIGENVQMNLVLFCFWRQILKLSQPNEYGQTDGQTIMPYSYILALFIGARNNPTNLLLQRRPNHIPILYKLNWKRNF